LFLGFLNAAFDIADRLYIFFELRFVARPEADLKPSHVAVQFVENAAIGPQALQARSRVGRFAIAEETFENNARIDFHRVGRGGSAP
jgi:hypothetical protein